MAGRTHRALAGVQVKAKRTPAYTYTIAYAGGGRYSVTVVDGKRHVVTAYADVNTPEFAGDPRDSGAHALGRELVAALTAEVARLTC